MCFPFANRLVRDMLDDGIIPETDIFVVHGTVEEPLAQTPNRYKHAWVETKGRVHDWQLRQAKIGSLPIKDFYELYKPADMTRYTPEQSMVLQLRHGHSGPWIT